MTENDKITVDEKGVDDDVADEEDFHQTKYDETH